MVLFQIDACRISSSRTAMIDGHPVLVYLISGFNSDEKRYSIYGRSDTCFTIDCELTLHNFYSYDKENKTFKFYEGIKCYKSNFGVYVNINGVRCYCTSICPIWMATGYFD